MHRRNFLKTGSIAGLTLTAAAAASCNLATSGKKTDESTTAAVPDDFVLNEVTIATLQQKMEGKEYTSRSITEFI
jgi:amidase